MAHHLLPPALYLDLLHRLRDYGKLDDDLRCYLHVLLLAVTHRVLVKCRLDLIIIKQWRPRPSIYGLFSQEGRLIFGCSKRFGGLFLPDYTQASLLPGEHEIFLLGVKPDASEALHQRWVAVVHGRE